MQPEQDRTVSEETITVPEPAHIARESIESDFLHDTDTDDEYEATEMRPVCDHAQDELPRLSQILSPGKPMVHWYDPIKRFWRHNIRISVPHDNCRDHLANERTFLGYIRTSIAFSIIGAMIAQFWRLQKSTDPSPVFGYYVLSIPIAVIFQCAALAMTLLGSVRFWRQQHAMALGKVHAGGWEINLAGGGSFFLLLMMFAVHVGIGAYQADSPED